MANDCNIPTRGRSTTKRRGRLTTKRRDHSTTKEALLIGIGYRNEVGRDGQMLDPIPTSIPNVRAFEKFLRESQGYTNIIVMTDEDGVQERYRPTKRNLKREIKAFRHGVRPGDRRVFYFAGHSEQMPCLTHTEEDSQDEAIVVLNGLKIRDNMLHNWLVRGLPEGSALTAIFDSCNSGTLLDLGHYHCNNVYRPWVNKGGRRSNTLRNYVVRKNCGIARSLPLSPRKGSGEMVDRHRSLLQLTMEKHPATEKQSTTEEQPATGEPRQSVWFPEGLDENHGQRTTSPERKFPCDGWCRERLPLAAPDHADVISISSSNDGQISWDASTGNGGSISMTTFLIDILKKHPGISTSEFMTRLAHAVHSFTTRMHGRVWEVRRARRRGEVHTDSEDTEPEEDNKGEMDNFQDLQLGSITPVDMDRPFVL